MLLVGVTGVGCCTVLVGAGAALGAGAVLGAAVSFLVLYPATLVNVFFFSFIASTVLALGAAFALVEAVLAAGFSGDAAVSSTTFLGLPRFFTAGGSTVIVADAGAAIAVGSDGWK